MQGLCHELLWQVSRHNLSHEPETGYAGKITFTGSQRCCTGCLHSSGPLPQKVATSLYILAARHTQVSVHRAACSNQTGNVADHHMSWGWMHHGTTSSTSVWLCDRQADACVPATSCCSNPRIPGGRVAAPAVRQSDHASRAQAVAFSKLVSLKLS